MTTIEIPAGSLFGTANLAYGVFSPARGPRRVGVRVGDHVVDLHELFGDPDFAEPSLNAFMAGGYERWVEVRRQIAERVVGDLPDEAVHAVADVRLHLPFEVADLVDFFAFEHHAASLGRLFGPAGDDPGSDPLPPRWRHLPLGRHGRSGTVIVSGTAITRPCGQSRAADGEAPAYGPTQRLDIEAEVGFVVGAGSQLGEQLGTDAFERHVFGAVLVNDWSARDLQAWEQAPLGPFLGTSFATSISPWVVPMLALQQARVRTPEQDPAPLPYLREREPWGLEIDLEVFWNGQLVARPPFATMYWSPAQLLAHLTANGARVRTGDLFASGTVSGPGPDQRGAFVELTWDGSRPVTIDGEERAYLRDGDEVAITASAPGAGGQRIGFGEVRTAILPANV